jgi:F0F1-type ATP synthase assembly protein I
MAEERLMDDDKDKKYRFKTNENGEQELVIDDPQDEEVAEEPAAEFEVPEVLEDDEEAAVMTPEQLKEKKRLEEKERAEREEKINSLIQCASDDAAQNKFSTALESILEAEKLAPEDSRVHAAKLTIYTKNFTEYENLDNAVEVAGDVKKYVSAEDKAKLCAVAAKGFTKKIAELSADVDKLTEENEGKKKERAVKFDADKKRTLKHFVAGAIPFVILLGLTIGFGLFMFAAESGIYLILTIVFGSLAFVNLVVLAFLGRALHIAARRVRLNKKNTSTKLGRQLIAEEKQLGQLQAIYSAIKD